MLDRFDAHQDILADLIRRADEVNLNATRFTSPITRLVRLSIGEALTRLVIHQRRPLQQALRLPTNADFPGA